MNNIKDMKIGAINCGNLWNTSSSKIGSYVVSVRLNSYFNIQKFELSNRTVENGRNCSTIYFVKTIVPRFVSEKCCFVRPLRVEVI